MLNEYDFNPRSPHGERPSTRGGKGQKNNFNPRSPHGERRPAPETAIRSFFQFQSTLPAWGATQKSRRLHPRVHISIHAPRMGSDVHPVIRSPPSYYFNPRSPHGERHLS